MKNSALFLICIFLIAVFSVNFQCGKELVPFVAKYDCIAKISLVPYKKVYTLNDTIRIDLYTNGKRLFDDISNSFINLDTARMNVGFDLIQLKPEQRQIEDIFTIASALHVSNVRQHKVGPGINEVGFITNCTDSNFRFSVSFVPKKRGIFAIDPYVNLTRCPNAGTIDSMLTRFVFDLADVNKDVWLTVSPPLRNFFRSNAEEALDKNEAFVFEVL